MSKTSLCVNARADGSLTLCWNWCDLKLLYCVTRHPWIISNAVTWLDISGTIAETLATIAPHHTVQFHDRLLYFCLPIWLSTRNSILEMDWRKFRWKSSHSLAIHIEWIDNWQQATTQWPMLYIHYTAHKYLRPGIGCTAQMLNSSVIWHIRCHVIAIRQSSAQLSIMNNCRVAMRMYVDCMTP